MDGLALQIQALDAAGTAHWEWVALDEDTSITIEMSSPIFGSGATFSYPFTIPVEPNRHILGNADQIHGARIHRLLHKRPARLYVCGVPFRKGIIKLDDEVEITPDGEVEIEFTSERGEWEDMIDGMNARDVEIRDDILIGVAVNRGSRTGLPYTVDANIKTKYKNVHYPNDQEGAFHVKMEGIMLDQIEGNGQKWPKYVLARGTFKGIGCPDLEFGEHGTGGRNSVINVSEPFDPEAPEAHPFCNVRICYQRHVMRKSGDSYEDVAARGYSISEADRANSAPNFFVLYWLYRLFKQLDITVLENALNDVEDIRRLFFVNTRCAYEEAPTILMNVPYSPSDRYGEYYFGSNEVYTGTHLPVGEDKEKAVGAIINNDKCYALSINLLSYDLGNYSDQISDLRIDFSGDADAGDNTEGHHKLTVERQKSNGTTEGYRQSACTGRGNRAYATSENLPDEDVKTVLEEIEKMFGARFVFDDSLTSVRVVLLRDILRDQTYETMNATVLSSNKRESNIRGFRLTYGQKDDTNYSIAALLLGYQADAIKRNPEYYRAYGQDAKNSVFNRYALKALGTRLRSDVSYSRLINSVTSFDKSLYYMPESGNLHAIKVDKDAKGYADLHASLFEVLQFLAAEDGDCSSSAHTEEISIGAAPAVMNDAGIEEEQSGVRSSQQFALFIDADMKSKSNDKDNSHPTAKVCDTELDQWGLMAACGDGHFSATRSLTLQLNWGSGGQGASIPFDATVEMEGVINEGFAWYPDDNFDPGDDGENPIESEDWGLTMCIMRGGGNDASIVYYDENYDGEGNSRWIPVAGGDYASHADTCDNYGRIWDYNGNQAGVQNTAPFAQSTIDTITAEFNAGLAARTATTALTNENGAAPLLYEVADDQGVRHKILFQLINNEGQQIWIMDLSTYIAENLEGHSTAEMLAYDQTHGKYIVEMDSSVARQMRLTALQRNLVYGTGSPEGRFSLKPRAEKPNPDFDSSQPESAENPRYLDITEPLNARRGLADVFYPEYSQFVRDRRIEETELDTEFSELLRLDLTKHWKVGDTIGLFNKVTFTADMGGINNVKAEMYYL